ncbi:MAG: hypothetical protein ACTSR2_04340, partial [Candidatus Hodarchaeales archaeon]
SLFIFGLFTLQPLASTKDLPIVSNLTESNSPNITNPNHKVNAPLSRFTEDSITTTVASVIPTSTSVGVTGLEYISGLSDSLTMNITQTLASEHVLLRLQEPIISDRLTLVGLEDEGELDTTLAIYGWNDPHTEPMTVVDTNSYDLTNFTLLSLLQNSSGDIQIQYNNMSLEFLLLVSTGSPFEYKTNLDAIEVQGFVSFIADSEKDGIPDIWQSEFINLTHFPVTVDLFGLPYEINSMIGVRPEGVTNLDFMTHFIKLGLIDEDNVLEDHFYVIAQIDLKMPFIDVYDYLSFLNSYDLVNLTYIENNDLLTNFTSAFGLYFGSDNRIRTYHIIDYTMDGIFNPTNQVSTGSPITGSYNMLCSTDFTAQTAEEKFDLDFTIALDIMENVLDAVKGGKDMTEQFMNKISGFIQGKIMDGVSKALLAKITKKALKTALKAILSITTIKGIIVKGIKILKKLGVPIPSWLQKIVDFVDSIPFIDPPVEIWKIRLSFINETTDLPVLGWDYINNVTIDTHAKGLYFGDTYSAQVILSSRDIFPVIGRLQSKNATRTITSHLYVEDFGLLEATRARSSLEPNESAQGRMYTVPPNGSIVISQSYVNVLSPLPITQDANSGFSLTFNFEDENGTALNDPSKIQAAISNLTKSHINLNVSKGNDGNFTLNVDPTVLNLRLDYHLLAILYKSENIFHDWLNYSFLLEDPVAPVIKDIAFSYYKTEYQETLYIQANITDYELNVSSIMVELIPDSTDESLAKMFPMFLNYSNIYGFIFNTSEINASTYYFIIEASDSSGNTAHSNMVSYTIPSPTTMTTTTTTTTATATTTKPSPGFTLLFTLMVFWVISRRFRVRGK